MSSTSSAISSPSRVAAAPTLTWKTAKENKKIGSPTVQDDTWYSVYSLSAGDGTRIRLRAGNRKYALTALRESCFNGEKKVSTDLALFRNHR